MAYLENNITVGRGQSRQLVLLDDSSHLQSNEEQCDIELEEGATLEMYRIQNLNDDSNLTTHINIKQAANSSVHFVLVTFNTGFVQNNINVDLNGEGADLQIYGLYLLDKKQHVENLMKINHNVPNCSSNEKFKGILDDEASAVFNGHVMVAPHAQKTNAYQNNSNIILTDKAKINTMPFLEIYADDVKCSHGATVGRLNEDELFYMRSRGVPESEARALQMLSFLSPVIPEGREEEIIQAIH